MTAQAFPTSIPVSARPFNGGAGTLNEQSITDALNGGVKYIRENNAGGDYWWAMTWLGELYPDTAWNTWSATGNLPTGNGAGNFSRVLRGSINTRLPAGTQLINTERRPQEEGSTTFFWSGSANATFHHRYQDNTNGNLAADGTAVANTYKLPMPASISNNRPFDIAVNDTGMNPDHFLQNAYGPATTLSPLAQFYRHQTNIHGSSLLAMRDATTPVHRRQRTLAGRTIGRRIHRPLVVPQSDPELPRVRPLHDERRARSRARARAAARRDHLSGR
jgi:hypothetical protein